tara:strand:- start:869 stop:1492 length:624 start_codon:yes stop_codon:yes gene_type:complete
MKTFKELREASCGYKMGPPKPKREDATDDAIAAFKAKGGKIKKLPPAKAAGYHGKDDPGKGMHGMMDKGDTKAIGTRKKVKSMGEEIGVKVLRKGKEVKPTPKIGVKKVVGGKEVKEISKAAKGNYIRKAADDMAKSADKLARADRNTDPAKVGRASRNFVNRRKGIAMATKTMAKDEGYVSAAQRRAVWASRADGGKGHPKNKGKK